MTTYLGTATGTTPGVEGDSNVNQVAGVKGVHTSTGDGVTGSTNGVGYSGVSGFNASGSNGYGVYGNAGTSSGTGTYGYGFTGVKGESPTSQGFGVYGSAYFGVYGTCPSAGDAIVGFKGSGTYAGSFSGDVIVNGNFTVGSGGTKSFIIDHPNDPTQKNLLHSAIESNERKNIYDGVAIADAAGEVTVGMPDWFEWLNTDLRYQLTAIGTAAPGLHVKRELVGGQFVIGGACPGQRVCWQVSGTRHDPSARLRPFTVEQDKPARFRGRYIDPEAYGQPESMGIAALYKPPASSDQPPGNATKPQVPRQLQV